MNFYNLILKTDSYKFSHWLQLPKNTQHMFAYISARGGKYEKSFVVGLQYYLKKILSKPITQEMIDKAEKFVSKHIGMGIFNKEGWQYLKRI